MTIPVEESQVIGVIDGNKTEPLKDIKGTLINTLENPIDSPALSTLAKDANSIVIVISDMTRFWMRQDVIVPILVEYLVGKCGKSYEDLEIIIATGTHVGAPEEDLRTLVTSEVYDKVRTVNHDCRSEDLVYLGKTSYGTPVSVNGDAARADLVICLGAATYHVMAGFGGGRKSILPGISSLETIKHNHAYSLSLDAFITNPEIGNHWKTSWLRACDEVRAIYTVPIKEKADVVITSCGGFPKDESLYQGTKAVDNVISSLKDGGTLILLLEGRNGGGSPDYFSWIGHLVDGTFEKELRENFTVGGYIFFLNCEQARRFNILMYSSIPAETVAPMGIRVYDDLDKLLSDAELDGKSVYIIPTGSTVLPVVENKESK